MKEPDLSDISLRDLTARHVKAGYSNVYKYALVLEAERDALLVAVRKVGDGGDLETVADLLQEATNEHGIDQGSGGNPYFLSDLLRQMAQALAALPEHLKGEER